MKIKQRTWLHLILIITFYVIGIFFLKKGVITKNFDKKLISRYYLSQDIPHEVAGKRLFLSDGEIYIATGYLYLKGEDPSELNFEHPPLIKYLFGLSTIAFNKPLIIQFFLGGVLLVCLYFLGIKSYKNPNIALLASMFLLLDPLFLDAVSQPLLDVGQTILLILYMIFFFYYKKNFMIQGILLGLLAGTKFWVTPIFFVSLFTFYKIYKRELDLRIFLYHLAVAFITYTFLYTQTFILKKGNFNIVWHVLKTFKYRIQHNISTYFGASLVLFISGYLKTWWGNKGWIRAYPWTLMWGFGLLVSLYYSFTSVIRKKVDLELLIAVIPIAYLLYLGVQAPFPRYFLIILPFIYLVLAKQVYKFWKKFRF